MKHVKPFPASWERRMRRSREPVMYSGSTPDVIEYDGDSDFAKALRGKSIKDVLPVIDELMTTLQVMHPRLYTGVMARI